VNLDIRPAERADLPAIVAIYNASIPGHQATADLAPVSVADRESWFAAHEPTRHPLWVGVADERVVGWISLSTFYAREAWNPTVEVSFYVDPMKHRQGVGRSLLRHALAAAPTLGIRTILAVVSAHNEASLALLESEGFTRWGHLPGVTMCPKADATWCSLGWRCPMVLRDRPRRSPSTSPGRPSGRTQNHPWLYGKLVRESAAFKRCAARICSPAHEPS